MFCCRYCIGSCDRRIVLQLSKLWHWRMQQSYGMLSTVLVIVLNMFLFCLYISAYFYIYLCECTSCRSWGLWYKSDWRLFVWHIIIILLFTFIHDVTFDCLIGHCSHDNDVLNGITRIVFASYTNLYFQIVFVYNYYGIIYICGSSPFLINLYNFPRLLTTSWIKLYIKIKWCNIFQSYIEDI